MLKRLMRIVLALLALVLLAVLLAWWLLRGSLPRLDGELTLAGLSAPITVQRDALGVVTIDAANETDAMRALGYVHAQERYFEMDLMRRVAAGELSELFGAVAVETDKRNRMHRMRARVEREFAAMAGDKQAVVQAYVDGVNAGLAALRVRPWPYLLLRQPPKPWLPADSALVVYAMYFDLQDEANQRELALWKIKRHLPDALYALLTRDGTRWDAPIAGQTRGDAVLPTPEQLDLRMLPAPTKPVASRLTFPPQVGSNSFAVSGALTRDGRAIVANDTHLSLRTPNLWFRARLRYPDPAAPGHRTDISGFTLPGLPAVAVGSNGHIAWGFTNSYVDTLDWRRIRPCAAGSSAPNGCTPTQLRHETIHVAGADPIQLAVTETAWGPVFHPAADGSALALRWTAHLPGAVNFGLIDFGKAANLQQALTSADRTAVPTQNLIVVDASGRIAWRLLGPLPLRGASCEPKTPQADSGTCPPWPESTSASPAIVQPASGRLWTANNRVIDGKALAKTGNGGFGLGARARQIRDDLFASQKFAEGDMLAIQLDDHALFLTPWWRLLQNVATAADTPALRELADAAKTWEGHASTQSVSYRIVRAWRLAVHERIADALTAPAQLALGKEFEMPDLPQLEGVVWPLVNQRPAYLLPRRFANWDALFEDAAREVLDELTKHEPLAKRNWGERNTAAICHPLAGAIPLIGRRLLCMPPDELAGDSNMPRVAAPAFGASERMVVSPGHEQDGIIHMPGGQSDNPLSPFWGAGHDDWVHGRPTPFLPGKTQYTLRLEPGLTTP